MNEIAKLIHDRRKELGLTLEEVGNKVGVGKSTVRKWENGMIKNMGSDKVVALARALCIDPVDLVPNNYMGIIKRVEVPTGKRMFAMDSIPKSELGDFGIKAPEVKEVMMDDDLKAILKIWKISTPKAKKAAIEMLKTLADEKEGIL